MESTGTAQARVLTVGANDNSRREASAPQPSIPASVRNGSHWFFWIVAAISMNSMFTIMGSHIHRFTGFGITAMIDTLAHQSGISTAMHVIVNGWLAGVLSSPRRLRRRGAKVGLCCGYGGVCHRRGAGGCGWRLPECGLPRRYVVFDLSWICHIGPSVKLRTVRFRVVGPCRLDLAWQGPVFA